MKNTTKKRLGRPPKGSDEKKGEYLDIRLDVAEKRAFADAAKIAGLSLSAWVRVRLRAAARKDLEDADLPVAFMPKRD